MRPARPSAQNGRGRDGPRRQPGGCRVRVPGGRIYRQEADDLEPVDPSRSRSRTRTRRPCRTRPRSGSSCRGRRPARQCCSTGGCGSGRKRGWMTRSRHCWPRGGRPGDGTAGAHPQPGRVGRVERGSALRNSNVADRGLRRPRDGDAHGDGVRPGRRGIHRRPADRGDDHTRRKPLCASPPRRTCRPPPDYASRCRGSSTIPV